MNMEKPDISPAIYSLLQHSQHTTAFVEKSFSVLRSKTVDDFTFQFLPLVIAELAAYVKRAYCEFY